MNKLKTIYNLILYKLTINKYYISNILRKSININRTSRDKEIIVSLTTYPKRLSIVYLTIESLMNQNIKADKIILWLSKEEINEKTLPKELIRLKKRWLKIFFVSENIKSYKKLIYSLEKYPNDIIITCDDDCLYPKSFIQDLYNTYKKDNCIIAFRCSYMRKKDWILLPYLKWSKPKNRWPSFNLFPTGVWGILYPPNSLNKEVLNKKLFLKLSPFGDDIWFKSMSLLNKTKVSMVNKKSITFPIINWSQKSALWHKNINRNENDKQIKNVFEYYNLYHLIN